jgi:hypothetical protein
MTAFNMGYYQRAKRRVNVLRGFDGCEPTTFTRQAAVSEEVTVQSGQVISLNGSGEWILGAVDGKTPYIALSDSIDTDVKSSGLLPALSCAGRFEIETAFYNETTDLTGEDIPVIADPGVAGDVTDTPIGSAEAQVIGFTSRGGLTNLNSASGPKIEVNAVDGNIVTFTTNWQPVVTAAT